ncbi:MAG: type II secretion system protein [Planctomycetota bacterium]
MRHRTHRPIKLPEASGFTLIELLVAVSLVGIVLTAGATLVYQVTQARARVDRLASHHAEADAAVRARSRPR